MLQEQLQTSMKLATNYASGLEIPNTEVDIQVVFCCKKCKKFSGLINDDILSASHVLHIPHRNRRRDLIFNKGRLGLDATSFDTCIKLMVHRYHSERVYVDRVATTALESDDMLNPIPIESWKVESVTTLLGIVATTSLHDITDPALLVCEFSKMICLIFEPVDNRSPTFWKGTCEYILKKWSIVDKDRNSAILKPWEDQGDITDAEDWTYRTVQMPKPSGSGPKPMPQAIVVRFLGDLLLDRPHGKHRKYGEVDSTMRPTTSWKSNQIRYNCEFARGIEMALEDNAFRPLTLCSRVRKSVDEIGDSQNWDAYNDEISLRGGLSD